MGNKALKEIDAAGGASNRGSVSAGRICGMNSSGMMILGLAALLLLLVFGVALGSSSGGS